MDPVAPTQPPAPAALEGGTYEVLRQRLSRQGQELKARLDRLNQARQEVFGSIPTTLLATERITTEHNCVPRDMVAIGQGRFLFGYNVFLGLKSETTISDVMAAYQKEGHSFRAIPLDFLADPSFLNDFRALYRYYKQTVFAKFTLVGNFLYIIFQTTPSTEDIKAFKWRLDPDQLVYVGNRFEHELRYPPQHEFEWIRTHRDLHRSGLHPHISIQDRVFVETIGGDLTIKVEDNTESGSGIYSEPVEIADQTLDDAEIFYASVGHLILLKIRPYQEKRFRYFAFNEKLKEVRRIDALEHSCVLLPEDHGIIFANGYYTQLGQFKEFPAESRPMRFKRRRGAPNGEDHLFVFYNPEAGLYLLLSYNVISQQVETPIRCQGCCFFENGEMALFQCSDTPQKHHTIQIWQTPYLDRNVAVPEKKDSYLFKLGNQAIVRCMAECQEVLTLIAKEDSYAGLFLDLVKKSTQILDTYFWINHEAAGDLRSVLLAVREAASAAVDEFEKVARVRRETNAALAAAQSRVTQLLESVHAGAWENINDYVCALTELRKARGEVTTLKERRYIDLARVESLERAVADESEKVARHCLEFLLRPEALAPCQAEIRSYESQIPSLARVVEVKAVEEQAEKTAQGLALLTETVSNLPMGDATQTTQILDAISTVYASLNQVKAGLKRRRLDLQQVEGAAQFAAQMRLLDQATANFLETADSPPRCEESLNRLLAQIQEIEARFANFEAFLEPLAVKREEICAAFETRRLALVEARNRRADSLLRTAERVLRGIAHRLQSQTSLAALESYFASDLMVHRVQEIVSQLLALEDPVKAGDLQTRLKALREEAIRQLRDRLDLFVDGANIIQLGAHKFRVHSQEIEVAILPREGSLYYHLTGTNFNERVDDAELLATQPVWSQELVSENQSVYRAEYLSYQILKSFDRAKPPSPPASSEERTSPPLSAPPGSDGLLDTSLAHLAALPDEERLKVVQQFMAPRFSEGYVKGIHDADAARLLGALLPMHLKLGLLRYPSRARACASLFWLVHQPKAPLLAAKLEAIRLRNLAFAGLEVRAAYLEEIAQAIRGFIDTSRLFSPELAEPAAEFLFHNLTLQPSLAISPEAARLCHDFLSSISGKGQADRFQEACRGLSQDAGGAFQVIGDWLGSFLAGREDKTEWRDFVDEAAVLLVRQGPALVPAGLELARSSELMVSVSIPGFLGSHPVLGHQAYTLHYHRFMEKLDRFEREVAPLFRRFQERKQKLAETLRQQLRLSDFKSQVLTSFVRNQLIDRVYLPLIGANLAKQIGVAGEETRTDRMGMLLLISPPGYGKTTLMEYIADRLGLVFMKINGPTLGAQVTSLDPGEARNAASREELQKLNLALEMGDNVMIYLDDIQHCHPEFLQKFISLCDAQRRIEGVWHGHSRTYDFRGKRVAVVMAGNPYTESGARFQIPDMLANRSDTYNLGEIIAGSADLFKASYLENALTSNPVLSRLSRHQKDFLPILRLAETGASSGLEFEGNYAPEEIAEFVSVTRKLIRAREVVLRVNEEYIRSAAQSDEHRTEPAFRLQGSYRNMNRLAERVLPVMNDAELEQLLLDHYQREAQTLASGAEANLLKLKEILGKLTEAETQRWNHIRQTFRRNLLLRGAGADSQDPTSRIITQLAAFSDTLASIQTALSDGLRQQTSALLNAAQPGHLEAAQQQAAALHRALEALSRKLESQEKSNGQSAGLDAIVPHVTALLNGLQDLKQVVAEGIKQQQQQATFRLIDPSSAADYQITSVNRSTLEKIWALIEAERGKAPPT